MNVRVLLANSVPIGASSLLLSASVKAYIWAKVPEGSDVTVFYEAGIGLTCSGSNAKTVDIIDSEYDVAAEHEELTGYTKVYDVVIPGTPFYIFSALGIVVCTSGQATIINAQDVFTRQLVLASLSSAGIIDDAIMAILISILNDIKADLAGDKVLISFDPTHELYFMTYLQSIKDAIANGTYTLTYRDLNLFTLVVRATTGALRIGYALVRDILILIGIVEENATLNDINDTLKRLIVYSGHNWTTRI